MAKRKSADELFDTFLAQVLQTVPEDQRAAFEANLKAEATREIVRRGVASREELSYGADDLKAARAQFDQDVQQARQTIDGWQKWYEGYVSEEKSLKDKVAAYEQQYGTLDPAAGPTRKTTTAGISAEDLQRMLAERDAAAIRFASELTNLQLEHRDRFKTPLDSEGLIKFAVEQGNIPLRTAYRDFVAEQAKEFEQKELDAKLKAAREDGAREALSQHKLPIVSAPTEPHVLDRMNEAAKTSTDRVKAAVAAWNTATHSAA